MALRMIQALIPDTESEFLNIVLKDSDQIIARWQTPASNDRIQVHMILPQDQTESVSDLMTRHFASYTGFRLVMMPVEATLPKVEQEKTNPIKQKTGRISREELYTDISAGTALDKVFITLVCLSAMVAAIGLRRNDTAIIIGAMVIAPLLTPNIGLALSAVLGDRTLAVNALRVSAVGIIITLLFGMGIGFFLGVDETIPAISARTHISLGDMLLALASGCAGALAFTTGVPASLTGVMVAVALMPPLVVCGMMVGTGNMGAAGSAFMLGLLNISCVNLSSILTFLAKGISPMQSWHQDNAKAARKWFLALWLLVVTSFLITLLLLQK